MTTMSALFMGLATGSVLFGIWMVVKKGWLQGFFLTLGAFFCLGGISVLYENSSHDKDEAPVIIGGGLVLILLTLIYWNLINRLTFRGPYKIDKE